MNQVSTVERPRRREYSAEFKASVLAQCCQQGASIAGVALGRGINPNMVHRWIREERQGKVLAELRGAAFVPVQLQPSPVREAPPGSARPEPAAGAPDAGAQAIRIDIERANGTVTVHWPLAAAAQCAQVLRELLR